MKTIIARGAYTVSFNTMMGEYEVGEPGWDSVDYAGDDVDALAAEVIADDPSNPLVFERVEDDWVLGVFRSVEDGWVVAVMFEGSFN